MFRGWTNLEFAEWATEWDKWTKLLRESGVNLNVPITRKESDHDIYRNKRDS